VVPLKQGIPIAEAAALGRRHASGC
jgi:hypothetical protein